MPQIPALTQPTPVEGRDGFLFLSGDSNELLKQHSGEIRQPVRWINALGELHIRRRNKVQSFNGEYYHIVVPNKETVLKDLLPEEYSYERFGLTPVRRYLRVVEGARHFTFFEPGVLRHYPADSVFRRDDTHWTALGAFIYTASVFSQISSLQNTVQFFLGEMTTRFQDKHGDLGSKIPGYPSSRHQLLTPLMAQSELTFHNGLNNRGRVRIFDNLNAPDNRVMVVTHDSFGDRLFEVLPHIFRRVAFIHTPDFDENIVAWMRPDIYINMQIERFFTRMPTNGLDIVQLCTQLAARAGVEDLSSEMRSAFIQERAQ